MSWHPSAKQARKRELVFLYDAQECAQKQQRKMEQYFLGWYCDAASAAVVEDDAHIFRTASGDSLYECVRIYSSVHHLHIVSHKSSVNFACFKLFHEYAKLLLDFSVVRVRVRVCVLCTLRIFSWEAGTFIISAVNMGKLTMSLLVLVLLLAFYISAIVRTFSRHCALFPFFSSHIHWIAILQQMRGLLCIFINMYVRNTENLFLSCSFRTIARCFPLYQTMLLLSAFPNLILFIHKKNRAIIVYSVVFRLLMWVCMCVYTVQCEPNELRLCVSDGGIKKLLSEQKRMLWNSWNSNVCIHIFIWCE